MLVHFLHSVEQNCRRPSNWWICRSVSIVFCRVFQKCVYGLFHKKSIIQPYINFKHLNMKKEAEIWVTQKNIEVDVKLAQKKEEQEKEIKENN